MKTPWYIFRPINDVEKTTLAAFAASSLSTEIVTAQRGREKHEEEEEEMDAAERLLMMMTGYRTKCPQDGLVGVKRKF